MEAKHWGLRNSRNATSFFFFQAEDGIRDGHVTGVQTCALPILARFNLTQAGRAKRAFIGLPSPAAGMTLATFYPFTTTGLWQAAARYLPRHHLLQFLMILLTILMVSNVRYATLPRAGLRSVRGLLGLVTMLFILTFGILEHDAFLFPLGVAYMTYGVLRATVLGFFFEAEEDEDTEIAGPIVITDSEGPGDAYEPRHRSISEHGGGTP